MNMTQLSVRARLLLLAATSIASILLIAVVMLWQLQGLSSDMSVNQARTTKKIELMQTINLAELAFRGQVQEWKNILIRGQKPEEMQKHQVGFEKQGASVQSQLNKALPLLAEADEPSTTAAEIEALKTSLAELNKKYFEALASEDFTHSEGKPGQAVDLKVRGVDKEATTKFSKLSERLTKNAEMQIAEYSATTTQAFSASKVSMLIIAALGIIATAILASLIIRSLLHSLGGELQLVIQLTQKIAQGDLTGPIADHLAPGSLLAAVKEMRDGLHKLITNLQTTVVEVSDAALNLSSAAAQVAQSSNEQSDATASMAAAIEQMSVSIDHVAAEANQTKLVAEEAGELSQNSTKIVNLAMQEMQSIVDATARSTNVVNELGHESEKISSVVQVIKEIADQTNLLALNAAIEAARAGEHGRGFSIVADEVRRLAERTGESTQAISAMIEKILNETQNAIQSIDEGSNRANAGLTMNSQVSGSIEQMQSASQRVVSAAREISCALAEQTNTNQVVAEKVEKIAQMTEENGAAVNAISAAAQQLKLIADKQRSYAASFKV